MVPDILDHQDGEYKPRLAGAPPCNWASSGIIGPAGRSLYVQLLLCLLSPVLGQPLGTKIDEIPLSY